jgi:hypothetical protein
MHGTYLADTDADEARFDPALCPWDCRESLLVDDELRLLFDGVPSGTRLTAIYDTCHSGSITRALSTALIPDRRRVRFMNPRNLGLRELDTARAQVARSVRQLEEPSSTAKAMHVSACRDSQYAYDARIGSKFFGVMTFHALQALEEANWVSSYPRWLASTKTLLEKDGYDQDPQLDGHSTSRRKVFQ